LPTPSPLSDQFGAVTGHAGLIATEFTNKKDEEIYGEDEARGIRLQVISGAVRSYKLLSTDGVRSAHFICPGDVFGLESGTVHRLQRKPLSIPRGAW